MNVSTYLLCSSGFMDYVTCLYSSLHLSVILRGEDERSSLFEGNVAHFTLLAEKLGAELNYPALSCLCVKFTFSCTRAPATIMLSVLISAGGRHANAAAITSLTPPLFLPAF